MYPKYKKVKKKWNIVFCFHIPWLRLMYIVSSCNTQTLMEN